MGIFWKCPAWLLIAASVYLVHAEDGKAAVTLTENTYEDYLEENPFVAVAFKTRDCKACAALEHEWEQAARQLKEDDLLSVPILLSVIESDVSPGVIELFEIRAYPTVKIFRGNLESEDYFGPLASADEIVQHLKSLADPNYVPPTESVVELDESNFDEFIKRDLVLVEFYAPWCGHCKSLAPKYEEAAERLLRHDPPIPLGKIDATANKKIADRYVVNGYPTMYLFRNGQVNLKSKDKIPRETDQIVDYMIAQVSEAATEVKTLKQLKNALSQTDVTIVGLFSDKDSQGYKTFQQACENVRDDYTMLYSLDESIRTSYKVQDKEAVVLVIQPKIFQSKYEPVYAEKEITNETPTYLEGYFEENSLPLVGEKTNENSHTRYNRRPLCILYVPVDWSHQYRDLTNQWRQKLLPIAHKYRDHMRFAMADETKMGGELIGFGLEDSGSDFSFGCFGISGEKYPMEEMDEWDPEEIEEFLEKVKNGKAKSYLRSAIPPAKQKGPVTVVVGKTFNKIVMDKTKDVLIEFYAPWCGHCKKLEPEYKKLAQQLSHEKNIVIAKMDMTANDAPAEFAVQGYPTIYFVSADNVVIKVEGERSTKALTEWLKNNATKWSKKKDEL